MKEAVLISSDATLIEIVEASAAAAKCVLQVVPDVSQLAVAGFRGGVVLIGVDRAAEMLNVALPSELELRLVGIKAEALLAWSTPLGAPTVLLPNQQGFLTALLADEITTGRQAKLLRVFGGSGGVGATTLAVGLAVRAAKRGMKTALVEADSAGGGVDLLFSAENEPGWRWSELTSARGHIGDLTGRLPQVVGVDLVSVAGAAALGAGFADNVPILNIEELSTKGVPARIPSTVEIPDEALRAVVSSLRRSHDLVIVDQGHHEISDGQPVVVVAADLRGVAAAKARLRTLRNGSNSKTVGALGAVAQLGAVLRPGPGRRLSAALAAEVLEVPIIGQFQHHKRLPHDTEAGDPPGRAIGSVADNLDMLLQTLLGEPASQKRGVITRLKGVFLNQALPV
ncbi:MAG: hypothetical protein LBJ43_01840 [Propionibacteriaceae bacterium]|nr:hypothetical protein [Propionibacteriaceae bacterium]